MSIWYEEDEPIQPFQDVTKMTGSELIQAMYEVDDDRKDLSKHVLRRQKNVWSDEDNYMMDQMNKWAKMVFDELQKRGQEKRKNLNTGPSQQGQSALTDKESLSSTSNQSKQDEQHRQGRREGEQDGKACGAAQQLQSPCCSG